MQVNTKSKKNSCRELNVLQDGGKALSINFILYLLKKKYYIKNCRILKCDLHLYSFIIVTMYICIIFLHYDYLNQKEMLAKKLF